MRKRKALTELSDILAKQESGRKLLKKERKVLADSKRSDDTKTYRQTWFPTPKSHYFGDIDYQVDVLKQRLVVEGKILGKADTTIQLEIEKAIYAVVKRVDKFYGIKRKQEKQ